MKIPPETIQSTGYLYVADNQDQKVNIPGIYSYTEHRI